MAMDINKLYVQDPQTNQMDVAIDILDTQNYRLPGRVVVPVKKLCEKKASIRISSIQIERVGLSAE